MEKDDLDRTLAIIEAHEDYRLLRRLTERPVLDAIPEGAKKAVMLDVEATGSDVKKDEIIELGMVSFAYTVEGEILGLLGVFSAFRQPECSISAEITALTGIDDAMVAGQTIAPQDVASFIEDADLIIAHNAAYDRPMVERVWPVFVEKFWACTMSEIDWKAEGFESMKLGLLLMQVGLFHSGHRATADCHAAIELLASVFPRSDRTGLSILLERARRSRIKISAVSSPYEFKDQLKQRGYRWTGEERRPYRSWQIEKLPEEADEEIAYLNEQIYRGRGGPVWSKVTARERFSERS